MATEFDAKKWGAVLAIPFTLTNATTGLSNSDLVFAGGGSTGFVAPGAGSVIGISARCAAITAGTITLSPHKAGTEYAESGVPTPALSSAQDTNGTYGTVRPGALTFAAGILRGLATRYFDVRPLSALEGLYVEIVALISAWVMFLGNPGRS